MELKELITLIKQFEKNIIPYQEYCDVWSEHYLFRNRISENVNEKGEMEWAIVNNLLSKLDESINVYYPNINIYDYLLDYKPIYTKKYNLVMRDGEKNAHWSMFESIAINQMYEQIEILLDSIDVELTILEMENSKKHEYICKELLPELLDKIQKKYKGYEGKSPHQICTHIFKYNNDKNNNTDYLKVEEMASFENEHQQFQKKHRIKILLELGILKFLKDTYPKCRNNESEIARIICMVSPDFKKETIQSYINDLMSSGLDKTKDKDLEIITLVNSLRI
jgi:predicted transcriptional regulator